jgi:enterobactin synthetase component F
MGSVVTSPSRELTPAQIAIWLGQRDDPSGLAYAIGEVFEIAGEIDPGRLERAIRLVVDQAEALRVRIVETVDGVRQVVTPCPVRLLAVQDVASTADPAGMALGLLGEMPRFDLARGPLFDFTMVRLGPARWMFAQRYHHIVCDGVTGRAMARRIARAYGTMLWPEIFDPAIPPMSGLAVLLGAAADYAGSSREAADQTFWHRYLADWAGPLRLVGRAMPPARRYATRRIVLDRAAFETLAGLARSWGVSWAQAMVGIVAIFLYGEEVCDDLVLGVAIAGRTGALRDAVGMLSNVLPVRLAMRPGWTPGEIARQVARGQRDGLRHHRYRGETLARETGGGSTGTFGPVVNVMAFEDGLRFGDHVGVVENLSLGPVDDLAVAIYDRQGAAGRMCVIDLNVHPGLYAPERHAALAGALEATVRAVIATPDRPIAALLGVGCDVGMGAVGAGPPVAPRSLAALFAAQAALRPEATAVIAGDRVVSYRDLEERARGFARVLAGLGVIPGRIVPVLLAASIEMVVAVLAVGKAGGAVMPLDPALPDARVALMLGDAGAEVVVTATALRHRVGFAGVVVCIDADWPAVDADLPGEIGEDEPAYVVYTSGSTGRPKGVVVPHHGLAALARDVADRMRLGPEARVLQFASVGFDAFQFELLIALGHGATLVVPQAAQRFGADLRDLLAKARISHALLPPAALAMMPDAALPLLGNLMVGGEACPAHLAARWSRERRLINVYGPTETTILATASDPLDDAGVVPIGRPVGAAVIGIFDGLMRLVTAGRAGGIYIAGDGVALGYLGEPALSAARFVACPFGPPGAVMYRTGDLGRWRPDGQIDFCGRSDDQVKIRGVRIEPGEIEEALCRADGVAAARVMLRTEASGTARLVAYVVAMAGVSLDPAGLRAGLAARLPRAMVPAAVMVLDELPLTVTGKLDRAALPAPDFVVSEPAERVATTPTERALARLFGEVLRIDAVDPGRDFFDLGGDSLLATLLLLRIRAVLGHEVSITALFEAPSVIGLAAVLDAHEGGARGGAGRGESVSPIAPVLTLRRGAGVGMGVPALFCIHPGPGLGWAYAGLLAHLPSEVPVVAIQARGLDGVEPMAADMAAMVTDYVGLIRATQPEGPYHLLGWSSGGTIAHAVAVQLRAAGHAVGVLVSLDGYPAGEAYARVGAIAIPHEAERFALRGLMQDYLDAGVAAHVEAGSVLTEAMITTMLALHHHTAAVLARGKQGWFDLDMLVVTCAQADGDIVMPPVASWRPYVGGAIESFAVPGMHGEMLMPAAAALIGAAVRERLGRGVGETPARVMAGDPFDDAEGRFVILGNAAGRLSLWPDWAVVPAGWLVRFGPEGRAACLAFVVDREGLPG